MEVTLADFSWGRPFGFAWGSILIVAIIIAVIIAPFFINRIRKIRDPVSGTAQVLSMWRVGSVSNNSVVPSIICRLKLQVQTPGSEPYVVRRWQNFAPW